VEPFVGATAGSVRGRVQRFLSHRYTGKIADYSGAKVQYLSERREGQYAEVRTKVVSDKVEIPMDYRLMNKSGR
jgi:phospholipid transport system substrate-binding protein